MSTNKGRNKGTKSPQGLNSKQNTYGLSEKERVFAETYMVNFNATEAAREAGYKYPKQSAQQVIKKDKVQKYLEELKEENRELMKIDVNKQVEDLEQIKNAYIDILNIIKKPDPTEEEKQRMKQLKQIVSANDLNKAVELQSKLLGLFDTTQNFQQNIQINIGGVSDPAKDDEDDDDIIDATVEDADDE